jgi:integrase
MVLTTTATLFGDNMQGCKPLTDQEISLMLNSLDNPRDKCLFLLGVKTGFRISELLSIKVQDCLEYNEIKQSITVDRRNTKGRVASRTIPINQELRNALERYLKNIPPQQSYLFESQKGGPISRVHAWRIIKSAAIKNKLKGKIATHSMRKSFADRVYKKLGKDLVKTQRAMGHKSIQSTVSYLSFTEEEIDKAILEI